ncbi:MAG: thiol reductant ABC exporter subunit CydD [Alphaproteobacteria bacterium]|nr:thiol reductant ABC exporter subunit CydD [Alphaproteobacteria bacterium]
MDDSDPRPPPQGAAPHAPAGPWLRLRLRAARREAVPAAAFGLLGIVAAIGQAVCAARALQLALDGAGMGEAVGPLLGFAGLALLRAGLGVLFERAGFDAGAASRRRLRSEALGAMLAAGPALLRRHHSAELATVVVDRVEALEGLFARWLPAAMLALAGPVLVVLVVLWVDPIAAAILAAVGLLVPAAMGLAGLGAAAAARRQFTAMTRLQARFVDRVRGIATIVLAGHAEAEAQALGRAAHELRRRTLKVLSLAFLSSAAMDLAFAVGIVVLALRYAAGLADGSLVRPGDALLVLLLVPEFFAPLRGFAAAYQDRSHAGPAAEALAALPEPPPAPPALPVRNVAARGVAVAFEDVCLTWDASRGRALDGVSFRVPAGETLILTGPSGSGKSSVLEILLGFVRPESGRVTLNGADIATLVPAAQARLVAWIGQRPVLFASSIRDNIRFARPEASDAEVEEAARFARLDPVLATLPQGLDTPVGEGGYGLSGGQAQRVAIARAFLKNAPLLLLDEPTAHLDPATEAEVLDGLRRLALGRTVVLASHAAAAHAFSGRRLDLRDGRVQLGRGVA